MISYWGVDHGSEVSKGWGADMAARGANAARKAKIKEGMQQRAAMRAWGPDDRRQVGIKGSAKIRNYVDRVKSGQKVSPPRARYITPDQRYYARLTDKAPSPGATQFTTQNEFKMMTLRPGFRWGDR